MANTFKFGNGKWAVKDGYALAYNDENGNFKPLPFDFTRASSATRVNKQGLIETVASGVPRIDYTDANGALLLEPQRTNLATNSQLLNTYFINKSDTTITDNYGVSPDGSLNSSRIQFVDETAYAYLNVALATSHTSSCYVKGVNGETVRFGLGVNVTFGELFTFNGEWQRIEYTTSSAAQMFFSSYSGATARDFEAFGAQLEVGSYATSYIPTQGSAVTRIGDVCTGAGNDQVINSAEGVLYAEISAFDNISRISLSDGSSSNRVSFRIDASSIDFQYRIGGTYSYRVDVNIDTSNTNKIAMSFNNGVFVGYLNGVAIGSPISGASLGQGVLDRLNFNDGNSPDSFNGNVKDVRIYNTALTDAELIALTTI
jgi:hypothetical protein